MEKDKTGFIHVVFFWLKEDITEEEKKYFEEQMELLGTTPSILSYHWGKPAGTPREVVDNSYAYGWYTNFRTSEDHDAYQDDPIHHAFINNCKGLWTKVQIYDTVVG